MIDNSILTVDDQELAHSIKQRNDKSLSILYDKYAPALLGVIKTIVNNEKLEAEILKSTFVKAWDQATSFNESKCSLFTWLINLARQTAVDEVKKTEPKNSPGNKSFNGAFNGSNVVEQQSAFELIYYAGLNCIETAALLQVPVADLRTALRMKIKKLL